MKWLPVNRLIAAVLLVSLAPAVGGPPAEKNKPGNHAASELAQEGDAFRSRGQLSSALWAYRQAARAGDRKSAFMAGDILFKQGQASSGRERILQLSEGLGDLYLAATHGDARACADLSSALENGIGVQTNLVFAYAWLELAAKRDPSFKPALDRLVVQLAPGDVRRAQVLAQKYADGQWPTDLVQPVDQGDARLRIQGISGNGRQALVIINNVSFAPGDSAIVQIASRPHSSANDQLSITCLQIGDDYVLVSIAGESRLKLLSNAPLR
ncbi:MAG TPA: hypothetical protein VG077_03525 [Verrucomicrobiae bacterium]|nr:hypothetical protein [Verrucomicrobiae bacterium]